MADQESQTRRFDEMNKRIEQIGERQEEMSSDVKSILELLDGDRFAEGMVDTLKDQGARLKTLEEAVKTSGFKIEKLETSEADHQGRISKLEKSKDRAIYTIMGMSIPSGVGVYELIKKIFG